MWRFLRVLTLSMMLVACAAIATADSHEEGPPVLVWINQLEAQPGQGDALVGLLMEDSGVLDPLVDEGAALEWGIAMPVVHSGGDVGVRFQWITFAGWAGVDAFTAKFNEKMASMSEDEQKAMAARWESVVVAGSHVDTINRSVHIGSPALTRPTYIHLGYWTARPGADREAGELYKEMAAPVYDQLVADGKIMNYGLHVPTVHLGEEWTHMSWYASSDLAARDAAGAAFEAAAAARSAEENESLNERAQQFFEPRHVDQILLVVHHKLGG